MAKIKRPTDAAITDALKANHGQYLGTAKALGVSESTLRKWLKPEHVAIHEEFYNTTTDIAEQQISTAVRRGEPRAVEFWLKMRGRERGWTEKQEVSVNANVQVHDVEKRRAAISAILSKAVAPSHNRGQSVHPAHPESTASEVSQ